MVCSKKRLTSIINLFLHDQHVFPIFVHIFYVVHDFFDKVYAKTADLTLFQRNVKVGSALKNYACPFLMTIGGLCPALQ